jgi:hypothetical protein
MPDREVAFEQTYFPAAKLRFVLRFEEFGDVTVAAKAPKTLVHRLKGTKATRGALSVQKDPDAPAGVTRFLLVPASGTASGGPQKEDASADGRTWVVGGIIPRTASLKNNGIRTASELKAQLKFVDLPFDPRVIRSCAVEFYLGCLAEKDFQDGQSGAVRGPSDRSGEGGHSLLVLPDEYVDQYGKRRTNLRFQGWVDEWEVSWPDDEEPTVTVSCRDNTKVLIDQDVPPKLAVSAKKPIDEAIANYLSNFPQFAGLSVEYQPAGQEVPVLEKVLTKTAFQPKLGPTPSGAGGASNKMSVWDYLTDIAGALGHIIRVDGTTVIIQTPRSITSRDFGQRQDDPFVPRTTPTGFQMERRHLVYGRNIVDYKVARAFGRQAPQNVEARSYNGARKKELVVRFPVAGQTIVTDAHPGDGHSERKYLVWRVKGVKDEKTLRLIAQSVYETVGRNELSVQIRTKNLASFGGGNEDPDLLDAKPGDAFELVVMRDADSSTLTAIEEQLLISDSARRFLEAAGYSGGLADAYAKAYGDAAFGTTFMLRDMSFEWNDDEGVSIVVNGVNYIEIRADKLLPAGEEQDPGNSSGATQNKRHQTETI